MIYTELRPIAFNPLDEDDTTEEEDGSPVPPKGDDAAIDPGNDDADGFGLDGDLIEVPGEEEF